MAKKKADPIYPAAAGGPVLNLVELLRTGKALVAAVKARNWFGDGGVLAIVADIAELLAEMNGGAGVHVIGATEAEPVTAGDLDAVLAELRTAKSETDGPWAFPGMPIQEGVSMGLNPALVPVILEFAVHAVEWFAEYWRRTHPAPA